MSNPSLVRQFQTIIVECFIRLACLIKHVLCTLMVRRQILPCSFYPPTIHSDALMTAYTAIVKAVMIPVW